MRKLTAAVVVCALAAFAGAFAFTFTVVGGVHDGETDKGKMKLSYGGTRLFGRDSCRRSAPCS